MAYRFKLNESFEEGFRRIAFEQRDRVESQLRSPNEHAVAVHETRKALKRLRALLRLVRPTLREHVFGEENAHLREIARILSGARDRHVLLETVIKLEGACGPAAKGAGDTLREILQTANGGNTPNVDAAAIQLALERLAVAEERFSELRLIGRGFEAIGPGLEASYRKGRRTFRGAYAEGTDDNFHEWRKSVQQHWRHMMLLSNAWPDYFAARVSEARGLSQIVGGDHDLALLKAFVRAEPTGRISAAQANTIEKLARQRQKQLRAMAQPMGVRLYAEGAKGLHRRMARYWQSAVARKEQEPEKAPPSKGGEGKAQARAAAFKLSTQTQPEARIDQGQGGAHLPHHEVPVRQSQSSIPRHREEQKMDK
ncbi:MAG: CHAD domain-containing protein [Hyphomicrobium sp.]|nr:CHAD domain-containing protein [Hyphomicrobium sp.]